MDDPLSTKALYKLLSFLSPAFPIGAFTYSHGLENAVENGSVTHAASLVEWLTSIMWCGAGRSDAILLKEAHQAALQGDRETLIELRELGLALQPSKERSLETCAQGTAFFKAVTQSWPPSGESPAILAFNDLSEGSTIWPYPAAVGLCCAAHGVPVEAATIGFLQAFAANIVSAAIRTVPLGQTEAQTVLAKLEFTIFQVAEEAARSDIGDLGTSTFLADIASMKHETQYSRLFRS
ncbi:urease accessory protein UreF [Roseibium hamelinense]|nr:urease accessory protein UreF [Roseibium hamelinense]MTI44005.1 urease accessory protein UreF [Roseibium hamelinense]